MSHCIALIVSVVSFFPHDNSGANNSLGGYDAEKDNLLFWKDISKYSTEDYLKGIRKLLKDDEEATELDKRFAEEIIVNSRIARWKYDMFKWSIKVIIVATLVLPVIAVIVA